MDSLEAHGSTHSRGRLQQPHLTRTPVQSWLDDHRAPHLIRTNQNLFKDNELRRHTMGPPFLPLSWERPKEENKINGQRGHEALRQGAEWLPRIPLASKSWSWLPEPVQHLPLPADVLCPDKAFAFSSPAGLDECLPCTTTTYLTETPIQDFRVPKKGSC